MTCTVTASFWATRGFP